MFLHQVLVTAVMLCFSISSLVSAIAIPTVPFKPDALLVKRSGRTFGENKRLQAQARRTASQMQAQLAERRARLASHVQRVESEIQEEVEATSASDERAPHRESTIPYNPKVTGNVIDFSGRYYAPGTRPKNQHDYFGGNHIIYGPSDDEAETSGPAETMPTGPNSEPHVHRDENNEIVFVSESDDEANQNSSTQGQSYDDSSDDAEAVANALRSTSGFLSGINYPVLNNNINLNDLGNDFTGQDLSEAINALGGLQNVGRRPRRTTRRNARGGNTAAQDWGLSGIDQITSGINNMVRGITRDVNTQVSNEINRAADSIRPSSSPRGTSGSQREAARGSRSGQT